MRTLDSKTFNGNFEITLVKMTGKRRIPHSKQWKEVTTTVTEVKGLENVRFFMYNDYGDRSVSFSLDDLNNEEIEFLKSKISGDTSKYNGMEYGEKEARLFDDSGLSAELAKAYTEWYGTEVRA
jgi:hypothetical protein